MFRTVVIREGEHISVRENWMMVKSGQEEARVPLEDLYCVVLDNRQAAITVPCITTLTGAGVHVVVCDEKHLPVSVMYGLNTHYRPLGTLRYQVTMPQEEKDVYWKLIVQAKLRNQARVLQISGVHRERWQRLEQWAMEVEDGDEGNREGIGAKWYFRSLFGSEFLRMMDDGINQAMNYGYAILRSAVAKALVSYGYNCVIGLHHINESNPFNLADDMMEPLRPVVDLWVDMHHEDLLYELTRQQRTELIDLMNTEILWNGKKMRLRNAIDKYISSFTTALLRGQPQRLCIPEVKKLKRCEEDEEDEPVHENHCDV